MAVLEGQLAPDRPKSRPKIYAYSIDDEAHRGQLKIGQTNRDVRKRIDEQLKTAAIKNFTIHVEEFAEKDDGATFRDSDVRRRLIEKGFEKAELEWIKCDPEDVLSAIVELKSGLRFSGSHHETFEMRPEQFHAVEMTHKYFLSIWEEGMHKKPRFLWNAKMRFGKTFATYKLAQKMGARRMLVVTFKPAVQDAWQTDLESHIDFSGWEYLSKKKGGDPRSISPTKPLVYFGSFQDLLGTDAAGNVKPKNEWIHTTQWDLVVFDEYHFGAHRESAQELFDGEEKGVAAKEKNAEYGSALAKMNEALVNLGQDEQEFLPISSRAFLYLSGTPFRALKSGQFIEEQIFNWTYSDEQRAKADWSKKYPDKLNPYAAMPEMRLLTYKMPDELIAIASKGEFDEFDLNAFFEAYGVGKDAEFKHKDHVQKWLDYIRGSHSSTLRADLKSASKGLAYPFSDSKIRPYLQHTLWLLPSVASVFAMANLLKEKQNVFYHDYEVLAVAGSTAGVGIEALPPVRKAIGTGHDTKTITLTCAKLTTGVTVRQWSSMMMLRNLQAPETYFQAAFRVQSPWSYKNPNGDNPNEEVIYKPVCFVFDFAPTRALKQIAEYGSGLAAPGSGLEDAVGELVGFLPVLAHDGTEMVEVSAGDILDMAISGTSANLLARKWSSDLLVNVDNHTLKKVIDNQQALEAIMKIKGFRALGKDIFSTIINKSEFVKDTKVEKADRISASEKKELTAAEKEYKSLRDKVQKKLKKFATRIPAFMYLTDYREQTLRDVITKLEPELFTAVTGLTIEEFNLLLSLGVFNSSLMNEAVHAFKRYEDSSLNYTGIDRRSGEKRTGLFDTVVTEND